MTDLSLASFDPRPWAWLVVIALVFGPVVYHGIRFLRVRRMVREAQRTNFAESD